jgi:hypothetical protein
MLMFLEQFLKSFGTTIKVSSNNLWPWGEQQIKKNNMLMLLEEHLKCPRTNFEVSWNNLWPRRKQKNQEEQHVNVFLEQLLESSEQLVKCHGTTYDHGWNKNARVTTC